MKEKRKIGCVSPSRKNKKIEMGGWCQLVWDSDDRSSLPDEDDCFTCEHAWDLVHDKLLNPFDE